MFIWFFLRFLRHQHDEKKTKQKGEKQTKDAIAEI